MDDAGAGTGTRSMTPGSRPGSAPDGFHSQLANGQAHHARDSLRRHRRTPTRQLTVHQTSHPPKPTTPPDSFVAGGGRARTTSSRADELTADRSPAIPLTVTRSRLTNGWPHTHNRRHETFPRDGCPCNDCCCAGRIRSSRSIATDIKPSEWLQHPRLQHVERATEVCLH